MFDGIQISNIISIRSFDLFEGDIFIYVNWE